MLSTGMDRNRIKVHFVKSYRTWYEKHGEA
jgi:hypothetical protein